MQFFTATILEWKYLLKDDVYKQIIIESLLFLKKEGSVIIYGFVIMPNHIQYHMANTGWFQTGKDTNSFFKVYSTTDEVQID